MHSKGMNEEIIRYSPCLSLSSTDALWSSSGLKIDHRGQTGLDFCQINGYSLPKVVLTILT